MTPTDRIAQLRDAFTTILQGLAQAREAVHQMEAELLDWAEEAGDIYAYQQANEPTPEPTEAEPTTDQATEPEPVSLEQVRAKLAALSAAGHTAQVQQLIQGRGVAKLSDIPETEYAALLADAEGIAA